MESYEIIDNISQNNILIDELFAKIEKEVAALYVANHDKHHEALEKEREEINRRYDLAIKEIQTFLETDAKLMQCTNGKLRHAYARDLAFDFF